MSATPAPQSAAAISTESSISPSAEPAATAPLSAATPEGLHGGLPQAPQSGALLNTSGFYRRLGDHLQFAAHAVHAPGYTLTRSTRAATALPKDGWDWFDSLEAAHAHHGLPVPPAAPASTEPASGRSAARHRLTQRP